MKSLLSFAKVTPLALSALLLGGCSDDDSDGDDNGGSAGTGGAAGSAGSGGAAGSAGSAGSGGGAGTGGGAGSAGSSSTGATAMSFFVTSAGSGADGGNLGGLSGADARCQAFAAAVGAGSKTWHAYLSTSTENARDRIGSGPWFNQAGEQIADSVEDLHPASGTGLSNGNPQHILDETGAAAPGNQHDILTGSIAAGTIAAGLTCMDWTSNSDTLTGQPQVGHSDIPGNPMFSPSWNAAHTAGNCSQAGLVSTGGAGRLYCFAIN